MAPHKYAPVSRNRLIAPNFIQDNTKVKPKLQKPTHALIN